MLFTKAAFCVSSLILLVQAQDYNAVHKGLMTPNFKRSPVLTSNLMVSKRDIEKRCTGTCAECFGDGYTLCPGSSIYCYLPGDEFYGEDSCLSSSDSTTSDNSTSSSGTDDICSQQGATCSSCFGPTYLECPDGYHCYDPDDPLYDTCPEDDGSSSSSDYGTTAIDNSTCADLYGEGNISCGEDSCYDPTIGESCCADGFYCDAGYTCSSTVGKCSLDTSTSSTTARATSTGGSIFATGSVTTTASGGSATGVSNVADNNGVGVLAVGKGLLLAAGVGALIL